jgi:excinuclease UvrABC nuclease subunit
MINIQFHALFDDFILVPSYQLKDLTEWFKKKPNGRGVYSIFDRHFNCLYIGSSLDLQRRLKHHVHRDHLKGHFEEVLFVGVRYMAEGDLQTIERKYIRNLSPMLNKYRYIV